MVISNLISFFILKSELNTINKSIQAIYKTNFPDDKLMRSPKVAMSKKLNLMTHKNNNPVFVWLSESAKALAKNSGVNLQAFDFSNGQLNLQITSNNTEHLDELMQNLKTQNLQIKTQDVALNDAMVKGTLIITENHV
jgi:type II secretory pathway component PulL